MKYTYGALSDLSKEKREDSNKANPPPWMIKPSNNSTSNPSLDNLASSSNGNDAETYRLLPQPEMHGQTPPCRSLSLEEALHKHVTGRHVRRRTILLCVAFLVALFLGVGFWFRQHRRSSDTSSWSDEDLIPYGNRSRTGAAQRAPFSQQHPVTDLGLYDYPRPKTANVPGRPLLLGMPQRTSYPTNAWYQSLLLPVGEPEVLHRAYAIPYVVDAAGPVPGLRIHPNHVDASSFVVQLYVIEEYGLTLGAARNVAVQVRQTEEEAPTHQYRVTHATPLGVTLDWVRLLTQQAACCHCWN
jgi:hypothetical protein